MKNQPDKNKKPDEKNNLSVEGHLRIFDPETKEEYLNKRG